MFKCRDHPAPYAAGMVGMVRNWLFTLFYCVSELWGDVVLSLLFWGLANETTSIEDAPLLYPLFGIGANIAQTMAGAQGPVSVSALLLCEGGRWMAQLHMDSTGQTGACVFVGPPAAYGTLLADQRPPP